MRARVCRRPLRRKMVLSFVGRLKNAPSIREARANVQTGNIDRNACLPNQHQKGFTEARPAFHT